MKLTWLGHSGFRIEIGGLVILLDPWMTGNPMFEGQDRAAAIAGATHVLITHGHGDHTGDTIGIVKELGVPCVGIYDLMSYWQEREGIETIGFNKGGTVDLGGVKVTMVNAVHSSSIGTDHGLMYAGHEAGYVIAGEGHVVYVSGDTDVHSDMGIVQDLHQPDIGILCIGGHFTMDPERAAYAAKKFFDFRVVIPCHYRTFPLLAQDAKALTAALPGVEVTEPEVMRAIEI
ncbi:metal-dependent hydrolase [Algicella marina]|uniref:UPF0173 metal-dependent hydrolase GO499_01940 n=1 Tax=Algicella marina TaxID=2683284 RepID=A0A6P1SXG8_9RHOB|nr:metal-dependent hydrolase [Algicella marina]QHQ34033.1 metal-dependent hydrolase [Algicella marina]